MNIFKKKLLALLLNYLGKRMNGYKGYIGGAGLILLGVVGFIGNMFPDLGLPKMEPERAWESISLGLGVMGIRHGIAKRG
jgi:hypothetical protein